MYGDIVVVFVKFIAPWIIKEDLLASIIVADNDTAMPDAAEYSWTCLLYTSDAADE